MSERVNANRPAFRLLAALSALVLIFAACKKESTKKTTIGSSPKPGSTSGTANTTAGASASPGAKGAAKLQSPSPLPVNGQPLPPDAIKPSEAGRYTYDETGIRKLGCVPDEKPASPTTLDVDPAQGDRQQSVRDQRYPDGHGIVTNSVLEFRKDGVYLTHLFQTQTFPLLGTFTTEFEPSPPVLVFPSNPKVGQSWSFTMRSKDGKVTVESTNVVESSAEAVTLGGGASVQAIRVKGTTHVTGESPLGGQLDITDLTTSWISIEARLILKTITDSSGTPGSTCRLDGTHIEAVVRSTAPGPR